MSPDDIRSIVAARKPESLTLEFKRDLPGDADNDKREFLADITAFANAYGGTILFGIREEDRSAIEVVGIPTGAIDSTILRLTNLLRDGVEPRVQNVTFEAIHIDGSEVLHLKIPQSPLRPHWVALKGHNKFYVRHSAGKHPMSIDEVRTSFLSGVGAAERAEAWRSKRANEILRATLSAASSSEGAPKRAITAILHLCPLGPSTSRLNVADFKARQLPTVLYSLSNGRPNHFGSLTNAQGDYSGSAYESLQVYRDFRIEAVFEGGVEADGRHLILQTENEANINRWLESARPWFEHVEYPFPAAVFLSYTCGNQMYFMQNHRPQTSSEPVILFDSSSIESADFNVDAVMRPIFDHVWQSFGANFSPNYNQEGQWVTKI